MTSVYNNLLCLIITLNAINSESSVLQKKGVQFKILLVFIRKSGKIVSRLFENVFSNPEFSPTFYSQYRAYKHVLT